MVPPTCTDVVPGHTGATVLRCRSAARRREDDGVSPDPRPTGGGGRLLRGPPVYQPRTPWRAGPALLATVAIVATSLLAARALLVVPGLWDTWMGPPGPGGVGEIPPEVLWSLAIFQVLAVALTLLAAMLFGGRLREVLALGGAPSGWRASVTCRCRSIRATTKGRA